MPGEHLSDVDLDAPLNGLQLAHYEPADDGRPALHVVPTGWLAPDLLDDLVTAEHVQLALEDPHQGCSVERAEPDEHQHLLVHLNAGTEYSHTNCLTAAACVGCNAEMIDTILRMRAGWVRRYIPDGHRWVGQAPFTLAHEQHSADAVATARSRLGDS